MAVIIFFFKAPAQGKYVTAYRYPLLILDNLSNQMSADTVNVFTKLM